MIHTCWIQICFVLGLRIIYYLFPQSGLFLLAIKIYRTIEFRLAFVAKLLYLQLKSWSTTTKVKFWMKMCVQTAHIFSVNNWIF